MNELTKEILQKLALETKQKIETGINPNLASFEQLYKLLVVLIDKVDKLEAAISGKQYE